jgi:hypothetical protein
MIHLDPALIAPDPVPADVPAPTDARALIEGQLAMLTRLAQVGMEIVEAVGREAKTAPIEAGLAFARVSRAVRMTIALQSRLMKDLAALDRADHMAEKARTTRRRIRLSQLVEDAARAKVAAQREAGGRYWADEDAIEDEIEQLSSEAYERLIDAEDGDISGRPLGDVAAGICKDLGLSPDWTARLMAATAAQPPADPPPLGVACEARGAPGREATRWERGVQGAGPIAARPPDPEPPPPDG